MWDSGSAWDAASVLATLLSSSGPSAAPQLHWLSGIGLPRSLLINVFKLYALGLSLWSLEFHNLQVTISLSWVILPQIIRVIACKIGFLFWGRNDMIWRIISVLCVVRSLFVKIVSTMVLQRPWSIRIAHIGCLMDYECFLKASGKFHLSWA